MCPHLFQEKKGRKKGERNQQQRRRKGVTNQKKGGDVPFPRGRKRKSSPSTISSTEINFSVREES